MAEDQPKKKKPYVKPMLFYEHFELSTHLMSCDINVKTQTELYVCGYENSLGQRVFNQWSPGACKDIGVGGVYDDPADNPDKGEFCYFSANGTTVFSS